MKKSLKVALNLMLVSSIAIQSPVFAMKLLDQFEPKYIVFALSGILGAKALGGAVKSIWKGTQSTPPAETSIPTTSTTPVTIIESIKAEAGSQDPEIVGKTLIISGLEKLLNYNVNFLQLKAHTIDEETGELRVIKNPGEDSAWKIITDQTVKAAQLFELSSDRIKDIQNVFVMLAEGRKEDAKKLVEKLKESFKSLEETPRRKPTGISRPARPLNQALTALSTSLDNLSTKLQSA